MKRLLILGPPGTGKTTSLLDIVDKTLSGGVPPERIAYVSFTQKAAYEARDLAVDRFNFDAKQFPHFRTLHSMAARVMGMKKDDFMVAKHYKEIGDAIGLQNLTGKKSSCVRTETRNNNFGNQLLSMIDVSRNMKMPLREYTRQLPEDIWNFSIGRNGKELKRLGAELESYKQTYGLRDYTDLILEPVTLGYPPLDVDVAIIDEAQDLTAAQWDFVNRMFAGVKELYIGGDDDQAIYQWNGADVDQFLRLEGERRVLSKSWRLPRRPWMLANWIVNNISERYEKEWTHKDGEGVVANISEYGQAPILEGGEWMILARNNAFLQNVQSWLINKGVPCKRSDFDIIKGDDIRAVHAWADLARGKEVTGMHAKCLYEALMTKKHVAYGGKLRIKDASDDAMFSHDDLVSEFGLIADIKSNWWDTLTKISEKKREYYRRIKKHGESLTKPRVTLSTIHGVKGGECENVVLLPDMARQTNKIQMLGGKYADEEHRVFYVGASRTKNNLYIMGQRSSGRYPLPKFKEKGA